MNIMLICVSLAFWHMSNPTIKRCSREYVASEAKVFLKDEKLNAVMVQWKDKKTKEFAMGYFKNATRNDTNFIYSSLAFNGDTVIRTDHYLYNISRSMDSSITRFTCNANRLSLYDSHSYKDGVRRKTYPQ